MRQARPPPVDMISQPPSHGVITSLEDGERLADNYQMLEELGSGSFGVVYKAIEKLTGEIVAIKHVSSDVACVVDASN